MFNITKRIYLLKDDNIDKTSYTNKQARQANRLDKNIIEHILALKNLHAKALV